MKEQKYQREPIPKRLRFEVFKRDSFCCQYCGQSAPNVLLHVDHIKPVSLGGETEILNLITACESCNQGKSNIPLSENSEMIKKKKQLDDLNERKSQIEMLYEWQNELLSLEETILDNINKLIIKIIGQGYPEESKFILRKIVKKYSHEEIIECIKICGEAYVEYDDHGIIISDSINKALLKLPNVLKNQEMQRKKPYLKDLLYARAILKNREIISPNNYRYFSCMNLMEKSYLSGMDLEIIKNIAKNCRSFSDFENTLDGEE